MPRRGGNVWWGEGKLAVDQVGHWQIGPYEFWLSRAPGEWRFQGRKNDEAADTHLLLQLPADEPPPEDLAMQRLGLRESSDRFRLAPLLADRSVVVRPVQPIALPPRQELVLYFSSPLWLALSVDRSLVDFVEVALQRPSDTWFGPNTREGEVCYSLRTSARLELEELPDRPHRAITELHVANRSRERLPLDRIRVPLPAMSLFATPAGRLWTEVVNYEYRDEGDLAEIELDPHPPAHAAGARRIAGPREELASRNLFRAFGGLIGGR